MNQRKRTEIAELGEFGLIDELTKGATTSNKRTLCGVGDDAAVIAAGRDDATVVTTDTMLEG
ncbi:MAG: thiamine-phosphate kinase, partial [Alistipes sp.]|nr:thiamine-phosphate kinase [Alistipes sp.]